MNVSKTVGVCVFILCTALFAQTGFIDDVIYECGDNSDGLEIGDIDNDGKNELVVGNRGSKDFSIFKMKDGSWNEMELWYTHKINWAMGVIHIADINGDDLNDVIIAHYTDYTSATPKDDKFGICFQNATTNMLDPEIEYDIPNGTLARALGVGDVNSDGRPDIVLANEGSGNSMYVFGWDETNEDIELLKSYSGMSGQPISISVGDVTNDQKNDVVVHGDGVKVFVQNSSGDLNSAQGYSGGGESADIGDINNDGLNDVVGNTAYGNGIETWIQTPDGTLESVGETYSGGYTEDIEIIDVNGDDLVDAVTASRDRSELYIFMQESGGLSDTPVRYIGLQDKWLNELAAGDLNGNGHADVAGSNWGNDGVGQIYEGSVSVWFYDLATDKLVHSTASIPKIGSLNFSVTKNQIKYNLFENKNITLSISDLKGNRLSIITDEYRTTGQYFIPWKNYRKSSGAYFITLNTEHEAKTKKFMVVK